MLVEVIYGKHALKFVETIEISTKNTLIQVKFLAYIIFQLNLRIYGSIGLTKV